MIEEKEGSSMRRLVVSTCGTSLLTNTRSAQVALRETANHTERSLTPAQKDEIDAVVTQAVADLGGPTHRLSRLSAELNGIVRIYGGDLGAAWEDEHVLLTTDTYQGRVVGEALADGLRARGLTVTVQPLGELNTATASAFRQGANSLVGWAGEVLPGYRKSQYRVVFNVAGGFKAFQGLAQTLGMFYADEVVYVFEGSDELIRIPRLPIDIDATTREWVRTDLQVLRKLVRLEMLPASAVGALPELFVEEVEGTVWLSPWGKLTLQQTLGQLYTEGLLEPWSDRVRFGPTFRASVGERVSTVNERIDDLCVFVETGKKLTRLDPKALQGRTVGVSTHECDAWADGAARRIYFHYEGSLLVVDKLAAALH